MMAKNMMMTMIFGSSDGFDAVAVLVRAGKL